jgi:hypothetical protein
MPNEGRFKRPEEYAPVPEAKLPETSEGWREIREELNAAIAAEEKELEKITAQIEEQALKAVVGDVQAQRQVQELRRQQLERELNVRLKRDALKPVEHNLKVAVAREAEAVENQRQAQIQALKDEMLESAKEFDSIALQLKAVMSRYHSLADRIFNLMTPGEQAGFHGARGSVGLVNAMAAAGCARPLGMGIAASPAHHMPLARFIAPFCAPPAPVTPAPERETVTITYQTEAEALAQARPR